MTQYDMMRTVNQELAKPLLAIDELGKMAEKDKLQDWADFGVRVYLLLKDIRAVLVKYSFTKPPAQPNGYIPTFEDVQKHIKMLFGDKATVTQPGECGAPDFEICERDIPIGALFLGDGVWTCLKFEHDCGGRDQPPDFYDIEVGNAATYYGALSMLAMELQKDRISHIIEAIGMEGIEECR